MKWLAVSGIFLSLSMMNEVSGSSQICDIASTTGSVDTSAFSDCSQHDCDPGSCDCVTLVRYGTKFSGYDGYFHLYRPNGVFTRNYDLSAYQNPQFSMLFNTRAFIRDTIDITYSCDGGATYQTGASYTSSVLETEQSPQFDLSGCAGQSNVKVTFYESANDFFYNAICVDEGDCNSGYEKATDGFCYDVDECAASTDPCASDPNSSCQNNIGGYECVCNTDYAKDSAGICQERSYLRYKVSTVDYSGTTGTVGVTLQLDGSTYSCSQAGLSKGQVVTCYLDDSATVTQASVDTATCGDQDNKVTFTNAAADNAYIYDVIVNDATGGRSWNLYFSFCVPKVYSYAVGWYSSSSSQLNVACDCPINGVGDYFFKSFAFLVGDYGDAFPSVSLMLADHDCASCRNEARVVVSSVVGSSAHAVYPNELEAPGVDGYYGEESKYQYVVQGMVALMVVVVMANIFIICRCLRLQHQKTTVVAYGDAKMYDNAI